MTNRDTFDSLALAAALALSAGLSGAGCLRVTSLAPEAAVLGATSSGERLEAVLGQPGHTTVETVVSADWAVPRGGLVNLDHPRAAGLVDGDEPIQVYFHVIRHPTKGTFLVDTGVERRLRDAPEEAAMRGLVASEMHLEKMRFAAPLGDWLDAHPDVHVEGVLMTHLHLDHLAGAPDLPAGTSLYVGPGEAGARGFLNLFVQPNSDRALAGKRLRELTMRPDPSGTFAAVVDLFGDGEVFAVWVPGHTPGSLAFVVRTPTGPVLLAGDTCHTRWGWDHDVEPGEFTADHDENAASLAKLRGLAARHPDLDVRLGHQ